MAKSSKKENKKARRGRPQNQVYRQMMREIVQKEMWKIFETECRTDVFLSDTEITEHLKRRGLPISKSIVWDVRYELGIPCSDDRRNLKIIKQYEIDQKKAAKE